MKIFKIKDVHLKLLQHTYISWNNCEFGAPSIDCKRPYGNSSIYNDMFEIIGLGKLEDLNEAAQEIMFDMLRKLHEELKTTLQICLQTLSFETGKYTETDNGWEKIK